MDSSNPSESPLEMVGDDLNDDALRMFKLLGNDTRLAILLTLWKATMSSANPLSFSEIDDRIAYESAGNLNYHLDQLVGQYIVKTEDGYELTGTGKKVIRAIKAGAITQNVSFGPYLAEVDCPYCECAVEVSYDDNYVIARCTECPGTFVEGVVLSRQLHPEHSSGIITSGEFPPAGAIGREPEEIVQASLTWSAFRGYSMLRGTCPECAGRTDVSTELCPDHDTSNQVCEMCGWPYVASTWMECQHCNFQIGTPTRWLPLSHPRVGSFFQDRGVDVLSGVTMRLWSHLHQASKEVHSVDPIELEYIYHVNEDQLSVEVRDEFSIRNITEL